MSSFQAHTSMFPNSSGFSIYGGSFSVVHGGPKQDGLYILKQHVAFGALHNSAERYDPPKCHPETRVAVLDTIDRWSQIADNPHPILWLHGAAGAGKSAIAQTLAERWQEAGRLAACFFFSRSVGGRNEKTFLLPTLAYQFTIYIPTTRPHIERTLIDDIGIFAKNLRAQMESLVLRPLKALHNTLSPEHGHTGLRPMVIIIDGLDECVAEDAQREILDTIFTACQHSLPISFLIACRPERQIRACFSNTPLGSKTTQLSLNGDFDPDEDIRLFLGCKFDEIRKSNPFLPPSWPSQDVISRLVEKSSGHFIYPSTVIKHLSSPRKNPLQTLDFIMGLQMPTGTTERPFADLDALYTSILSSVYEESLPTVNLVLSILLFFPNFSNSGLWSMRCFSECEDYSPSFCSKLLGEDIGVFHSHLIDLHSILEIPTPKNASTHRIRILHASLSAFLMDVSRSGPFHIDKAKTKTYIGQALLRFLPTVVRRYASRLEFSYAEALQHAHPCEELKLGALNVLRTNCYRFEESAEWKMIHLDDMRTTAQLASVEYLQRCGVRIEKQPIVEGEVWRIDRRRVDMQRCVVYRVYTLLQYVSLP